MAKQAKSPAIEISDKDARKFINNIFEHLGNIESAKGSYMNAARVEREGMVALYEGMAAQGISQTISKLMVKIAVATEKIKGWQAELSEEERKIAVMLAKAIGEKRQLSFWDEEKQPRQRKPKKSNVVPMTPTPELSEIVA
jgi:hypothetical protein